MTEKYKYKKWLVLILIMLNSGLSFFVMGSSLGMLVPMLVNDLALDSLQVAGIIGAIPMGGLIFSFFSGIFLDKYSPKLVMIITTVLMALTLIARGFSESYGMLYIIFMLGGVTHAQMNPANNKISSFWFGKKDIFMVTAMLSLAQGIASVTGYRVFGPLCEMLGGWGNVYTAFAIAFIVLAVIWIIFVPNISNKDSLLNKDLNMETEHHTFMMGVKEVLSSKQVWMIMLGNLLYFGTCNMWMSLAPTMIAGRAGIDMQAAAVMTSYISFGSILGYIFGPIISNKLGLRKPCLMVGFAGSAILQGVALFLAGGTPLYYPIIILAGFGHGWAFPGPNGMLLESPEVGGLNSGMAISISNVFCKLSAVIYPYINAFLATKMDPVMALAVATGLGALGAIFIAFANETGSRAKNKAVKA